LTTRALALADVLGINPGIGGDHGISPATILSKENTNTELLHKSSPKITKLSVLVRLPLSLKNVRLIPLTDVDIHVPANIKVVGLDIRVIVIALVHKGDNFLEEIQSLATVMALVMININVIIARPIRRKTTRNLVVIIATHLVGIADKINLARLDIQDQGGMISDGQGGLDAILLTNPLDGGSKGLLEFLRNVGHLWTPGVYRL
jgi:hypothetical protein